MPTATEELRGPELLRRVVNHIIAHRDQWYQGAWHRCKTVHCVGGWCQVMGGKPQSSNVLEDVIELLEISERTAQWLCASQRNITEIYLFAKAFIEQPNRDSFKFELAPL